MSDTEAPIYHSSQIARARNADAFIWWPALSIPYPEVIACFDHTLTGSIPAASILRWIELLARRKFDGMSLGSPELGVPFKHLGIMKYGPSKTTQLREIAPDEPVGMGDYFCKFPPNRSPTPELPLSLPIVVPEQYPIASGLYTDREALVPKVELDLTIPAPLIQQRAADVDITRCLLTGNVVDVDSDLRWIIPPMFYPFVKHSAYLGIPKGRRDVSYRTSGNIIPMRKDLRKLFDENAFGVDVDDDFKVYRFHKSAVDAANLPERLDASKISEDMKPFLRAHFRWTLSLRFLGGSIEADFPSNQVWAFRTAVEWDSKDSEDDYLYSTLDYPIWETPIGRDAKILLKEMGHV